MTTLLLTFLSLLAFQSTQPAAPAVPAAPAAPAAAPINALLQQMHDAGVDLRTLSARVELEDYDTVTQSNPIRSGTLALRRDDGGAEDREVAFHVVFNARKEGPEGASRREKQEYLLLNDVLVDRNYAARSQVTRKLSKEMASRDLLKLGEGPFPLPIGQTVAEVRAQFDVIEYDPADEKLNDWNVPGIEGTRRLRLTPKPTSPLREDFAFIDVDVDPESGMPQQVATVNKGQTKLRIATLKDIQKNAPLEDGFTLEEVDLSTWNVTGEEM